MGPRGRCFRIRVVMAERGDEAESGPGSGLGSGPESGPGFGSGSGPESGPRSVSQSGPRAGAVAPPGRVPVPGVVYLGHIPPRLRPKHVRNLLSGFGEIGRVFLQRADGEVSRRRGRRTGSRGKSFTEGWVEFEDKAVAKTVSTSLHNTPIGSRKRSRFHDDLWNIKYLHRFKWAHLSERLAYEKLVHRQRLQVEVSQAKRESNFFLQNVEKSKGLEKLQELKRRKGQEWQEKSWHFQQRATEAEIQAGKAQGHKRGLGNAGKLRKVAELRRKSQSNTTLLTKIFKPGVGQG